MFTDDHLDQRKNECAGLSRPRLGLDEHIAGGEHVRHCLALHGHQVRPTVLFESRLEVGGQIVKGVIRKFVFGFHNVDRI